jgi:RNA polymerase sigma-70 factor (ECF subfamily)
MSAATVFMATPKNQREEFEQVFQEHYDLTYRTAYSITRRAEDAEDVVQTVFLQLLRREAPPDLTKNPKGYLYRAAVSLSLKTIRSRQRFVLTEHNERFEAPAEPPNLHSSGDEDMERLLWEAIAELRENAAQILILRYIHGYALGEIANMLHTTRSTVAVSLFRSRARLKKVIRAHQSREGKER